MATMGFLGKGVRIREEHGQVNTQLASQGECPGSLGQLFLRVCLLFRNVFSHLPNKRHCHPEVLQLGHLGFF